MSIVDRNYMHLRDGEELFPVAAGLEETVFLDRERLLRAIDILLRARAEGPPGGDPDDDDRLMARKSEPDCE